MAYFHKKLTQENWNSLPVDQQILNIGAELLRARNSLAHHQEGGETLQNSLDRALELIDLTVDDRKWPAGKLKELLRFREVLAEFYASADKKITDLTLLLRVLLKFSALSARVEI